MKALKAPLIHYINSYIKFLMKSKYHFTLWLDVRLSAKLAPLCKNVFTRLSRWQKAREGVWSWSRWFAPGWPELGASSVCWNSFISLEWRVTLFGAFTRIVIFDWMIYGIYGFKRNPFGYLWETIWNTKQTKYSGFVSLRFIHANTYLFQFLKYSNALKMCVFCLRTFV